MLPRLALVDPDLTLSLPPAITAATGLDALTQLIEPFLSNRANPLTDLFCLEGMRRVAASLLPAVENSASLPARTDLSYASLLGGMALANAGLGAVHGLAAPIGGMFHAPHGAVCACLLPLVFELNYRLIQNSSPGSPLAQRFDQVAQILLNDPSAGAAQAIRWLFDLRSRLQIPGLAAYGIQPADCPAIASAALQASSMKPNPVRLQQSQLIELLHQAL
jgi:alcohol dehydrogenase class IV